MERHSGAIVSSQYGLLLTPIKLLGGFDEIADGQAWRQAGRQGGAEDSGSELRERDELLDSRD